MQTFISLSLTILLFIGIRLLFKDKIKIHSIITYIVLILLPFIVAIVPFLALIYPLYESSLLRVLFIWISTIELFVLIVIYLVKVNTIKLKELENKKELNLKHSEKLFHYAIVLNIIYVLPILSYLIWIFINIIFIGGQITNNFSIGDILSTMVGAIFLALFLSPITIALGVLLFMASMFFIIATITSLIMAINGTIRTTKEIPSLKSKYIFLMFVPYINIITMFYLCYKIKKELK